MFSVTELLTNVVYNSVPHNWKKHQQQLNVPLRVFQITTQVWPDEEYRLGTTTQRWEDDETIVIRKRHETQIKQDVLKDVATNKKGIEQAEKRNRMIAEYEKMISERKLRERKLPLTSKNESEDETYDESEDEDETYREKRLPEMYSDETYVEETECGYCGTVFSDARKLKKHYGSCSERWKYSRGTSKTTK